MVFGLARLMHTVEVPIHSFLYSGAFVSKSLLADNTDDKFNPALRTAPRDPSETPAYVGSPAAREPSPFDLQCSEMEVCECRQLRDCFSPLLCSAISLRRRLI